jgi:hypothetical protein
MQLGINWMNFSVQAGIKQRRKLIVNNSVADPGSGAFLVPNPIFLRA